MQVNIDTEYIEEQVRDALDIVDWNTVEAIFISGSFANKSKEVTAESDVDVELVVSDFSEFFEAQGDVSYYDGMNPADIHITANDGEDDYGERTMDLITSGEVPDDIDLIRII